MSLEGGEEKEMENYVTYKGDESSQRLHPNIDVGMKVEVVASDFGDNRVWVRCPDGVVTILVRGEFGIPWAGVSPKNGVPGWAPALYK